MGKTHTLAQEGQGAGGMRVRCTFGGAIGYGIRDDVKPSAYNGKDVCIIGGGAFAVENLRTALLKEYPI